MPNDYCYITKKISDSGYRYSGIYIDCPYNPEFIEIFKQHIPASDRKWMPELKQWWVSEKYAAQAIRDAKAFYENVMEV